MKNNRFFIFIIVLSFLAGLLALPYLPEQVAIHWNAAGEPDNYGHKLFGALFLPIMMIFLLGLFHILPSIDPKKKNYTHFKQSYQILINTLAIVFLIIHLSLLGSNLGYNIDISFVVPLVIGLLFIVIGNYMPKMKHNYFVGIRTPWTLASERVWYKTHRLGGKVFVFMGVVAIFSLWTEGTWRFIVFISVTLASTLFLIIQSYRYYKQETK
ncbi:SdpI family protein [Bacillus kexueae]|uniref:SdpI family protein n=1 Tax=Aeribacillus kexueae TaxID=2078952 RepID=UPI001FAF5D9E|nr:SdpI family protein [Bacillus kexueae]